MIIKNYFTAHELRCRCDKPGECDAEPISIDLVMRVNALRALYGSPLDVSSARRCKYWNSHPSVKGSPKSQHLKGKALDIAEMDRKKQDKIFELAEKVGFAGIGRYEWGIHLDVGPSGRRWDFRKKKAGK